MSLAFIPLARQGFSTATSNFVMMSYTNVVRSRLRLKGQPPIPDCEASNDELVKHQSDSERDSDSEEKNTFNDANSEVPEDKDQEAEDTRTEAQKQYDSVVARREKGILRKAAGKSYREQVEVSVQFHVYVQC